MSQIVRSTGIGFSLGAFFMAYGLTAKHASSGVMGIDVAAKIKPLVAGVNSPGVAAAVWVSFCLGAGLFAGGMLWPRIENVAGTLKSFFVRKRIKIANQGVVV